jgi:hypothetical protein
METDVAPPADIKAGLGVHLDIDVIVDLPGIVTVVQHAYEHGDVIELVHTSAADEDDLELVWSYVPVGALQVGTWKSETHGGHLREVTTQWVRLR